MLPTDSMHSDKPQWHNSQNPANNHWQPTVGILPVKLDDRHPEVGSDPKGYRVPPTAAEMERWAAIIIRLYLDNRNKELVGVTMAG